MLALTHCLSLLSLLAAARATICLRDICEYTLVVRHDRNMVYRAADRTYPVEPNGTRLQLKNTDTLTFVDASDVITADGVPRTLITINGQFPGPTIQVRQGAQVAVRVVNRLVRDVITIHWHGVVLRRTPWMDGVPHLTQCPIQPRQSFTYRFMADVAGSFWYHSHTVGQLLDGLYGMLVVHAEVPKGPEFPLLIGEWFWVDGNDIDILDQDSVEVENRGTLGLPFLSLDSLDLGPDGVAVSALRWQSALINGRGRSGDDSKLPLTTFRVKRGERYRFRCVNVGGEFAMVVSVDDHVLRVLASDGGDLEPFDVEYIIVHQGETVDFELHANQIEGRYWLRVASLSEYRWSHGERDEEVTAILMYESIGNERDPTSIPRPCTQANLCRVFNCPFEFYPHEYNRTCIHIHKVLSTSTRTKLSQAYGLGDEELEELFLNIGFHIGSNINLHRLTMPDAPLYQQDANIVNCEEECLSPSTGCTCTHILKIPFNKTIQLVISNLISQHGVGHHPMHLHGHTFAVLHTGFPEHDRSTGRFVRPNRDVQCIGGTRFCQRARWTDSVPRVFNAIRPPVKNTVLVPAQGYAVVRFRSDNPGFWLFHCHINHHMGMAVIFEEAPGYLPPPPTNMPTCTNFDYTSEQLKEQVMRWEEFYNGPGRLDCHLESEGRTTPSITPTDSTTSNMEEEISLDKRIPLTIEQLIGAVLGGAAVGLVIAVLPLLIYICYLQVKVRSDGNIFTQIRTGRLRDLMDESVDTTGDAEDMGSDPQQGNISDC